MATVALSGIITPTNVVTATSTTTLTNKTLTAPTIASANLTTALTLAGAAGTNGQVLTSAGSGLPTWTTPSGGYTLGTPVASTSGTAINFTGIPAGVKQIVFTFKAVSTNGSNNYLIQIGDSGGIESSNYESLCFRLLDATYPARVESGVGFVLSLDQSNCELFGSVTLTLQDASSFSWVAFGAVSTRLGSVTQHIASGGKSLSAVLDRIRLTTVGGTDAFDGGSVNIAYI